MIRREVTEAMVERAVKQSPYWDTPDVAKWLRDWMRAALEAALNTPEGPIETEHRRRDNPRDSKRYWHRRSTDPKPADVLHDEYGEIRQQPAEAWTITGTGGSNARAAAEPEIVVTDDMIGAGYVAYQSRPGSPNAWDCLRDAYRAMRKLER